MEELKAMFSPAGGRQRGGAGWNTTYHAIFDNLPTHLPIPHLPSLPPLPKPSFLPIPIHIQLPSNITKWRHLTYQSDIEVVEIIVFFLLIMMTDSGGGIFITYIFSFIIYYLTTD